MTSQLPCAFDPNDDLIICHHPATHRVTSGAPGNGPMGLDLNKPTASGYACAYHIPHLRSWVTAQTQGLPVDVVEMPNAQGAHP